jgi:hypothetical protein
MVEQETQTAIDAENFLSDDDFFAQLNDLVEDNSANVIVSQSIHEEEENIAPEETAQHILAVSDQIEEKLSTVEKTFSLVAGAMSIFQFLSQTCPHCVMSVANTATSIAKTANAGFFPGHWHPDGTYHEDDHMPGHENSISNPFAWLRVDHNLPSLFAA